MLCVPQLRQGIEVVLATGQRLSQSLCLLLLAEAIGHTGQAAEGLSLLAEALAAFEIIGRGDLLTEAYRLKGELLLQANARRARSGIVSLTPGLQEPDAAAETCWLHALALAHRQHARAWELRVVLSLSRLWQRQGKHAAARLLLAEIYGCFTEGLDTADLQDARALLQALA